MYKQSTGGYYYRVYKNGKKKRVSKKTYLQKARSSTRKVQKAGVNSLLDERKIQEAIADYRKSGLQGDVALDRGITRSLRFVVPRGNNRYIIIQKKGTSNRLPFKIVEYKDLEFNEKLCGKLKVSTTNNIGKNGTYIYTSGEQGHGTFYYLKCNNNNCYIKTNNSYY